MYYRDHTADTYNAWKEAKKAGWKKKKEETSSAPARGEKSLKISEALKTALCTNLCISEEDLSKIIDSTDQEN